MTLRSRIAAAVFAVGLLTVAPAMATVTVEFVPQSATVVGVGNTVDVGIYATSDQPIWGWGLDVSVQLPAVASLDSFAIAPAWDAALSTIDGDLLGGTTLNPPPAGTVLLATLTFVGHAEGVTFIGLNDGYPSQQDEGFALDDGLVVKGTYPTFGQVTVIPEPATLALLAFGGLALFRRR